MGLFCGCCEPGLNRRAEAQDFLRHFCLRVTCMVNNNNNNDDSDYNNSAVKRSLGQRILKVLTLTADTFFIYYSVFLLWWGQALKINMYCHIKLKPTEMFLNWKQCFDWTFTPFLQTPGMKRPIVQEQISRAISLCGISERSPLVPIPILNVERSRR